MTANIHMFVKKVVDGSSNINPVYTRNFRELLKLIPLVGSWIDANTVGAVQDAILAERLNNLEAACGRALLLDDGQALCAELANINSIFCVILVTHMVDISAQYRGIAADLGTLLAVTAEEHSRFEPHPDFRFVTISGPSAVGKDCILDLISYWKDKSHVPVEALTKFTTRPKRIVDSKYYDFVSEEQFDQLEKSGNVIFPYYKRDVRYGFDRTHLMNAAREAQVLFSVFTHFESLPTDQQFLRDQGIRHIAVLLTADEDTLILRSDERPLKPDDISARKVSIQNDLEFIAANPNLVRRCFDLVIDNGDAHAKHSTYNQIVRCARLPEMALLSEVAE